LSKSIVEFAVRNRAGVIKLELLEGYGQSDQNAFFLRNWSYFELETMIEYKAKRTGITVVKIDPYHTSQTCSACGHYEEGQRKEREFECKKCGVKIDADYNAAINIARSDKVVKKKEECEFYKQQQGKGEEEIPEPQAEQA
jgi:putative transposase